MAESSDSDEEIVAALLLIKDLKSKRKERLLLCGFEICTKKGEKKAHIEC